jgi:ferredoxin
MPAAVDREACNGCAGRGRQECVFACPCDAIALVGGRASIDRDACDDCKACVESCPVGAIAQD